MWIGSIVFWFPSSFLCMGSRWCMCYLSIQAISSSERHLLSEVAPTLSLKTPYYGVFVCGFRYRLILDTLAFDSSSSALCLFLFKTVGIPWRYPYCFKMEQMMGIEPTRSAWKAEVLPLNYICISYCRYSITHRSRFVKLQIYFNSNMQLLNKLILL